MRLEVFRRAFSDQVRPALKVWGTGVGVVCLGLTGAGYVLLRRTAPAGFEAALESPAAWLNTTLFSLALPLLLTLFSIWTGSRLFIPEGEEESLGLLLAYPIRRGRILIEKFAALAAGQAVLGGAAWGVLTLSSLAAGFHLPAGGLARACLNSSLLGLVFGATAFAFGASLRSVRKSRWGSLAAAVLLYVFFRAPDLLPQASFLRYLSPLTYAVGGSTGSALPTGQPLVLLALAGSLLAITWKLFENSDL